MNIIVVNNYEELSRKAANIIAKKLILNPKINLGLATGSTPIGMYRELIKLYNEKIINFEQVKTFNLDEYCGIDRKNKNSYYYFMKENFFDFINVKEENINIPKGEVKDFKKECVDYENKIIKSCNVDIQVLGMGRNGHIGFNEPDCYLGSKTHIVELDEDTRNANSRFFNSIEEVPRKAITMGIKTIMNSKEILLLVSGNGKSDTLKSALYGEVTNKVPASILQLHPNVTVIIDKSSVKFEID